MGETAIIPITVDYLAVQISKTTIDQIVKIKKWKLEKKSLTNETSMIRVIGDC